MHGDIKKLIKKLLIFSIVFTGVFFSLYKALYWHMNIRFFEENKSSIFVWGDSQVYQGLNLELLSSLTKNNVISLAWHGNGVYDLLVFSYVVPDSSICIVGFSKPALIRPQKYDRNMSGLFLRGIYKLFETNYGNKYIYKTIKKNIRPRKIYNLKTKLYPDKVNYKKMEQMKIWKYYTGYKQYMRAKEKIYMHAVNNLVSKGCKIIMIEYPFYPSLYSIDSKSDINQHHILLKEQLVKKFGFEKDTITVDREDIFYDLTHLNVRGANIFTQKIAQKANSHKNWFIEPYYTENFKKLSK